MALPGFMKLMEDESLEIQHAALSAFSDLAPHSKKLLFFDIKSTEEIYCKLSTYAGSYSSNGKSPSEADEKSRLEKSEDCSCHIC